MCGLPLVHPPPGTWLATQACALTGNRTRDALIHRPAINALSHTARAQLCLISLLASELEQLTRV